jgi:hypothetical protein
MKWLWFAVLTIVVAATRVPYFQQQLFSYDDVNLAYAVGEMDIRISQPHPPGYPLFVMEMRLLRALRVKRAESSLQILALVGSVAAVAVMIWGFPHLGGTWGAALLTVHPVFWYAGLTSALRIQLALVSLAVAAACWRAWQQRPGWDVRSAWIFGLGAGVRPELGLVLLPLWWWTSRRAWKHWLAAVALWLVPLLWSSGGPVNYVRHTWHYLQDQSRLTSGLFGADTLTWGRIGVWLLVWVLCGVPGWALTLPLSSRPAASLSSIPWRFLAIWALPGAAFLFLIHVADPGQTLAVVAPVCLIGGIVLDRARARLAPHALPVALACLAAHLLRDFPVYTTVWAVPVLGLLAGALVWLPSTWVAGWLSRARLAPHALPIAMACLAAHLLRDYPIYTTVWAVPLVALLAGALVWLPSTRVVGARLSPHALPIAIACLALVTAYVFRDHPAYTTLWAVPLLALLAGALVWLPSIWVAGGLVMAPAVIMAHLMFWGQDIYTKGPMEHVASALTATSFAQVKQTTDVDDRTIREVRALLKPGSVIVWERGITSWRKLTYYFGGTPVLVLDRKTLAPDAPSIKTLWLGPRQQTPMPLSPDAPIVWVRGPHSAEHCPGREQFVCAGRAQEIRW